MHRRAIIAALAVLAALPARAVDPELLAVAQGVAAIDAAELRGELAAERTRRLADAAAHPEEVSGRFLALYASPRDEGTWSSERALAARYPRSAWPHVGMARIYLEWRVADQVEAELARALALAPQHPVALRLRGQLREQQGRTEEARSDFRAALVSDPRDAAAWMGLARLARAAGSAVEARQAAAAALQADPDHAPALALLGQLSLEAGDHPGAARLLGRAVAGWGSNREVRVALAALLREQGDLAGALAQWQAAAALKDDLPAAAAVAELAGMRGDAAAEQKALERVVALEPARRPAWKRLGELRLAQGDADGAEAALRKGAGAGESGADGPARAAVAKLLAERGDYTEALAEYRAAGDAGREGRAALEARLNVGAPGRGEVGAVQRSVAGLVNRTYQERVKAVPSLSGTLRVRVAVDRDGQASGVEVLEDTVHDEAVRATAYWNLKDASYPKDRPGRYAFSFSFGRR
ncbi:MAG TPA: tetratricopeptide repeat protein [Anaeromyxobacteraceae bacterium]|nr:tetratricopeptide repeat protein [Anaeromyxobacteraceae bacterium]